MARGCEDVIIREETTYSLSFFYSPSSIKHDANKKVSELFGIKAKKGQIEQDYVEIRNMFHHSFSFAIYNTII